MTICYLYLWLVNISHAAKAFATYHLWMISAIIQVGPIKNRTKFLGVPDLHANHFIVWIGKEKAPNFQLPDTEIYVIVGNNYDKSREGQMYICDSTLSFSLAC